MHEVDPRSLTRLDNVACAYCHRTFGPGLRSQAEHVVGRKFVPKGSLAGQWNLVVNACPDCNVKKGELENDVSALTMRPDPFGRFAVDPRVVTEARRKETARSGRTGVAVRDSAEQLTVRASPMPGVNMSINVVTGPQLDESRWLRLAHFHVAAFFYLITFNHDKRRGSGIPGGLACVGGVLRPDWGNPRMLGFQKLVSSWPSRLCAITADGFFKAVIRRAPSPSAPLWAWALEWNQSFRVIGFFGDHEAAQRAFEQLPALEMVLVERGTDPEKGRFETRVRAEVPLAEGDDRLFGFPLEHDQSMEQDPDG